MLPLFPLPLFAAAVHDKSARHVFVYVCAREISGAIISKHMQEAKLRGFKLVILDRSRLMKLYGPTLQMHPAFLLQSMHSGVSGNFDH